MTITFNSLVLNPAIATDPPMESVQWIAAESAWTMGGKLITWEKVRKTVDLDLISGEGEPGGDNWGWITRAELANLKATIAPGATYTLNYHGEIMTVSWRTSDPPCLEYQAVQRFRRDDQAPADFVASLRMKLLWHSE